MKGKIHIKNVLTFFQTIKTFHLISLKKETLSYIERCFTILVDDRNFLEFSFNDVRKILLSSKLYITSELEVYDCIEKWLKHNFEERKQHAKDLLLTVGSNLLSKDALKCLLNKTSCFTKIKECVAALNETLKKKDVCDQDKPDIKQTGRYCTHVQFDLLFCGGLNKSSETAVKNASLVKVNDLEPGKGFPPMINARRCPVAVFVKGEVFVFGGRDGGNNVMPVEKYSPFTNAWVEVAEMPDRRKDFCACAFTDKVLFFGGAVNCSSLNYCAQFDTTTFNFKEIAQMKEERSSAACAVFEEKVVVSGGTYHDHRPYGLHTRHLDTVESYDFLPNKWSKMPSMVVERWDHVIVAVKSKLFVIEGKSDTCEVYDSVCKKFVVFKSIVLDLNYANAIPIGNEICAFQNDSKVVIIYDAEKGVWYEGEFQEGEFQITKYIKDFSCIKLPRF